MNWDAARGGLIVSCQASAGDAFYEPGLMVRFAAAAVTGGAKAIRAHGPADISSIRAAVAAPVLGIYKEVAADGQVLITPSMARAREIAAAGADAIALDATARGIRYGAHDRLAAMRRELGVPVLADIATIEEAEAAVAHGADFVLSTMRGFTSDTRHLNTFEPEFIGELVRRLKAPVIAEGRIAEPWEARAAMEAGAWAVVCGTAITRPHEIAKRFARAVDDASHPAWIAALDLGGTFLKFGLVSRSGEVRSEGRLATPTGSAQDLLTALETALQLCLARAATEDLPVEAVGVSTAGWVDSATGRVTYATATLPGWAGSDVRSALAAMGQLPVFVDNDGIATAAGEWLYGELRGVRNGLCVTLGTGIGCGAVVNGRLLRGTHGLAPMLGHLTAAGSQEACACGRTGCIEAEALAHPKRYGELVAEALAHAVHLLDCRTIVVSGGRATPELIQELRSRLQGRVLAWKSRQIEVVPSALGPYAGVRGAAALAVLSRVSDAGAY